MNQMQAIVIDIDDTLIETKNRTHAILENVLDCKIAINDFEKMTLLQIFEKYATNEQKAKKRELQQKFQKILLCWDGLGIELMKYHEPIINAVGVVNRWYSKFKIIYLTGRLDIIHQETLDELEKFEFPIGKTDLIMFNHKDWKDNKNLVEGRKELLSPIVDQYHIIRVVDDFPPYFSTYQQLNIPDRVGLQRTVLHKAEDYIKHGATRVFRSWEELNMHIPV